MALVFSSKTRPRRMGCLLRMSELPGVGSITLPDEAAPQNDIATIDGSVGAAGFSAVGTIAVPLSVASQHPTHRLLHAIRRSGKDVLVRV